MLKERGLNEMGHARSESWLFSMALMCTKYRHSKTETRHILESFDVTRESVNAVATILCVLMSICTFIGLCSKFGTPDLHTVLLKKFARAKIIQESQCYSGHLKAISIPISVT